ncbi:mitochondrial FAD carrier protein flx1 [Dimargaris cristalligena]|uniref:Mitochondrial carrier domain-containing protein n=1 Tax=Dimargaris cristalligena TaxID=215637 RepID=A0A4P9ZY66_9FUNG|nr:mitochondrial FAD carrier protein flx1 [Dimargaris cristalligena]RKP38685.1 mitochondrial carrier domain-containing protein [Dimargaris cristalligena]|eukprot:RKP38685.1 mitochondrial carrier domain-containing protein [Dimargaris cristalligena]
MTTKPSYFGHPSFDHAVAGMGAATVSTLTLQPLDLVKTRLQADESVKTPKSRLLGRSWRVFRSVVQEEGLRGLYRGLTPNLAGNIASWGLYFFWYDTIKQYQGRHNGTAHPHLSATQYLVAAAEAGALTQLCANPLWVVKTRMFTTSRSAQDAYRGLWHGLRSIYRTEGIRGLYKGLVPGLFGVSHGSLQFMAYESMKRWRNDTPGTNLNPIEYMTMAASSKVFATVCTYPYQVVRTRLQNQRGPGSALSLVDLTVKIYQHESFLGFYKGLGPNIVRVLPGTCITFVVYEFLSHYFQDHARF